jgi:hypothetical protein
MDQRFSAPLAAHVAMLVQDSPNEIPLLPVHRNEIHNKNDARRDLFDLSKCSSRLTSEEIAIEMSPENLTQKCVTRPKTTEIFAALLTYCISSILMTVTNKYVLSTLHFPMNFLLLAIQVSR